MNLRLLALLGLIPLLFISCSDILNNDDTEPKYKKATINNARYPDSINIGDSIAITFYFPIEDSAYQFHEVQWEKLEAKWPYEERFQFEIELIRNISDEKPSQDSVVWQYYPTVPGTYELLMLNPENDTLREDFNASYQTFELEMEAEDYQTIVDYVANNYSEQYIDEYGTGEYYFGANSYYVNFDLRISPRIESGQTEFESMGEGEAIEVIHDRLKTALKIVLRKQFPDAEKNARYIIKFETYNNDYSRSNYRAEYECTSVGDNLEFEFISMEEYSEKH
ncbi:MAG: hypothetical protein K9J27_13240 [Bacteroidales bacterium]|nr:hypothetical protein [Bacteroidales bacterium]